MKADAGATCQESAAGSLAGVSKCRNFCWLPAMLLHDLKHEGSLFHLTLYLEPGVEVLFEITETAQFGLAFGAAAQG